MSHDPSSVVAVQQTVPDTKAEPERRTSTNHPLSSEYSLFELETFFTRWAPDTDSVSPPGGPSSSLLNEDSTECDQDGVIIVESEAQAQHALQPPQGPAAERSRVHVQPARSQALSAGSSVFIPRRMQTPSSQPPWSRTSSLMRSAQAHRISSRMSAQTAATSNTPSVSSSSRTLSSAAPPVRGSSAALVSIDISAQHRASLLSRHNKSQAASMMPGVRRRKSYVCRACGKAFSGLSNLEAHERVHTGEKPFHCDTCGKRFSEAGNLKKHQRVHTGEKPFSCEQCGKRFAWICNLRTHQQSATGCGLQARGGLGLG